MSQPFERQVEPFQALLNLPEPNTFPVPLRDFLHPPEPFAPEDVAPLVLEEEPDEFQEVHTDTTFEGHPNVAGTDV